MAFFSREPGVGLDDEEEEDDEDEDHDDDHEDDLFDSGGAPAPPDPPVVNVEIQPAELTEEEALELAIAQSELEELG